MSAQKEVLELLNQPEKNRDNNWENRILELFPQSHFTLSSQHPQLGPDKFPYMFVEIKEDSKDPAIGLLHWAAENGIGLAINPQKSYPDFVFTYGMVWNFIHSGKFLTNPIQAHVHGPSCNHDHDHSHHHHEEENKNNSKAFYAGKPSENYLPKKIREVLKEFLQQQGIMLPKIIMLSQDQKNFDLCFSYESFGSPEESEHEGILQALSWFLPAHYSLALVSEQGLPEFEEL